MTPPSCIAAGDLAIPLTPAEYAALVGGDLQPAQIAKLRLVFGPAWEWSETFYAAETFAPRHPRALRQRVEALHAAGPGPEPTS